MTTEELRTLFCDMQSKGLTPMLCDTEEPLHDASVPTHCAEDFMEPLLLPKGPFSLHPVFTVTAWEESMKDAGIVTGDVVKVKGDAMPFDGDIVLASVDGEFTLKTYFQDDEGRIWLVPQNEDYVPILLDGSKPVKIYGKVREIVKTAPRVPIKLCAKAVKRAMKAQREKPGISDEQVKKAIAEIAPKITIARHWYAVYRVLVDKLVLGKYGYDEFVRMVSDVVPEHEHLLSVDELQRLAVDSFSKPVEQWHEDNAPVRGKRFYAYVEIAHEMENLLA